jgi:ribonucleoside-diphosphate reductase alpha chain
MYREAWERGLKTTYYLRIINRSGIDSGNRRRRKAESESAAAPVTCSIKATRNGTVCEACQ